ncbi:MAG TPA: rod shape-determining protein [Candidatus Alectryocaccobium stercorigallinarum]|jgi:rod shape-determining protein MreB|nr:rod shape-determining protein [Candidatus Alectryocaccobium stercorigallinarum]
MFYKQEFGIDLGTDTIKIYDKKTDTITVERNLIAVRSDQEVLGVGNSAYEMLNRAARDTAVMSPVTGGRINDIRYTEALIHLLLFEQKHYIGHKPSIYFAVPTDMTEIERRAYASIARRGRLKGCTIYLVEKPVLDALALGLPIKKAKGSMMINMGAFSTELSAIADSNVILSKSVPIAGKSFDESIAADVRKKNMLNISLKSAETLKISLLGSESNEAGMFAEGIDTGTGLPRSGYVTRSTVGKAVKRQMKKMTEELRVFLERIPPQVRSTALLEGIYLTGGSSRIPGFAEMISESLGYPVHLSSQYQFCTINGLKEVVNYSGANKLAYTPLTLRR